MEGGLLMSFVHLHVHSEYSLLRSTAKIEELVITAKELGYSSLALTDMDAMYGAIPFYKACRKHGIKPIIGVELAYAPTLDLPHNWTFDRIILLAKNNEGYQTICRLITMAHEKSSRFDPFITYEELANNHEEIIAIIPFHEGAILRSITAGKGEDALSHLSWLQTVLPADDVYLEIQNHWRRWEREGLLALSTWLKEHDHPVRVIASNHVHFLNKNHSDAHKVIQAIRLGVLLEELPDEHSCEEYYLKSPKEMEEIFSSWKEAYDETVRVAEKCQISFDLGQVILPRYPLQSDIKAADYLRELALKGVKERYEEPSEMVYQRLDYELEVITKMHFEDYFLIVADFMKYAHEQGIITGPGRGSSAGSLVAYALKITNVDPIKYGLLFERFLNPERVSMPDIDIDFSDERRDEVIQYVKNKYGKEHVAQIITFGTLAAKAAIRDVGRVLGIDLKIIDRIAKNIPSKPNTRLKESLEQSGFLREQIQNDEKIKELFQIAMEIEGLPRHTSIHAAGIVMSDTPLTNVVPLQEGNDDMYLTQFPMGDLEEVGLLKMDFLGLRNLSFIERILNLIHLHRNKKIDLSAIPFHDQKTYELLGKGETSGVFQLESSGMKSVLRRLKPTEFEDIVAVNALYRPGPMENIPQYIKRKHQEEEVYYPHEALKGILEPTYGVIIYQEQIMQIASLMAGFSIGEADILRRAISKKKREILEELRNEFINGALNQGYRKNDAMLVYDLILRFADYGFPRSHAVAYSIIAYHLAYLKANYLLEFMCALMNGVTHHHEKLNEYVTEARRLGIKVHPPSISESERDCVVKNGEIWLGLSIVKNVGIQTVDVIIRERSRKSFTSLFDLCARISSKLLPKRSIDALIVAGALDGLHHDRAQLLASVEIALEYGNKVEEREERMQTQLFIEEIETPDYVSVPPLSEEEQLNFEKQVLGFYASGHPIEGELQLVTHYQRTPIVELFTKQENSVVRIAGMIEDIKVILTRKKQQMAFVTVSDETGEVEMTVFPEAYQENRLKLQKGELVFLEGKVHSHDSRKSFILEKCTTIPILRKKYNEKKGPKLYLKITYAVERSNGLEQLKKLLEQSPGNIPVILVYERTNQALKLSDMWNVSGEQAMIEKLQAVLGKRNVYLQNGVQ